MAVKLVMATLKDLKAHKDELIKMMGYSLKINGKNSLESEKVYEKLIYYFELGKANVWLALEDKRVVGYAQFFQKNDERVHLNEIAVAEGDQNKGVGSILMDAVEHSAREYGATSVELFCHEINSNAKNFYGKHLYVPEKYLMVKSML